MRMRTPSADPAMARWWSMRCRTAATPSTVRALMDMNSLVDVRKALTAVRVPTLVMHRTGDPIVPVGNGRYLAEHIAGARYVELPGDDHFVSGYPDQILDPIEEFLAAAPARPQPALALAAVLGVAGPGVDRLLDGAARRGRSGPRNPDGVIVWCCSTGRRPPYAPRGRCWPRATAPAAW